MTTTNISDIPSIALQSLAYIGSNQKSDFYRALWNDKDVFIKTLRSGSSQESDQENFLYEIRMMALFKRCSFIVHLYGKTQLNSTTVAMVMEYIGQNLRQFLADPTQILDWPDKYRLSKQAALAVSYMHGRKACHGDIKSRNFLIDCQCHLKLCDFGYSFLQMNPAGQLIQAQVKGKILCSPLYLQPERLGKNFKSYDEKCDIYDLGLVMGEIATRKLPNCDAKNPKDIIKKLTQKLHDPLPLDCPEEYKSWTERARAFDPKERPFASSIATGLGKALRQINNG